MKYCVYFETTDEPYCGWLGVESEDLILYDHFAKHALKFNSKEDALQAANIRLAKLHKTFDKLESEEKIYSAAEAKKNCKFWIFEMTENRNSL